jgi:hypothetical protein
MESHVQGSIRLKLDLPVSSSVEVQPSSRWHLCSPLFPRAVTDAYSSRTHKRTKTIWPPFSILLLFALDSALIAFPASQYGCAFLWARNAAFLD